MSRHCTCTSSLACANAKVLAWVGRTDPVESGIQSTARPEKVAVNVIRYCNALHGQLTLILQDSGDVPMLFRTAPELRLASLAQLP